MISAVYDAALDSALWTAALEKTGGFLRSAATMIGSFDALESNSIFNFSWGYDPTYTALYVERYAKVNPLIPASGQTKIGEIVSTGTYLSEEELFATRVYQEWAKPQGYIDAAQATLEKSGTALAVLAAVRHESVGRVDHFMLRRMSMLVPHFRRAVLIGKLIDLKTIRTATFAETIDGLAAGIFLVDRAGAIVHANISGKSLLDNGDVVRLTRGILSARDGATDRRLSDSIAAAEGREADLAGKGIGIPLLGANGQSHIAHVLPLASGGRSFETAIAAVFIRKATLDLDMPLENVARRYRLTPTETKVLRAVVEHGGVTSIAEALGMSEATVKTHLQHLFGKTETSRQVDLVKLTFRFAEPFAV